MAINKVIFDNNTLIDITDTTATADDVAEGKEFYLANGVKTLGTSIGGNIDNITITKNSSNQMQAVGVIDQNTETADKFWSGTLAEYNAIANKDENTFYNITDDVSDYVSQTELATALNTKQDTLISGTNIKTINNESILGSGNIVIQGGGGNGNFNELTNRPSYNGTVMSGSTNIPEVPTKTSDLTNDSGFINNSYHDSTKQDIIDSTHKLPYSNISGTPTIPTKTSDLTNDSNFITNSYHDNTKQDVINTSNKLPYSYISDTPTIPTNTISSTSITTITKLTQAQYNALSTKDSNTMYVIVG